MNSDLDDQKERAESHPTPTKSQVRTELHYYLVIFFWLAIEFKVSFKELTYSNFKRKGFPCE